MILSLIGIMHASAIAFLYNISKLIYTEMNEFCGVRNQGVQAENVIVNYSEDDMGGDANLRPGVYHTRIQNS